MQIGTGFSSWKDCIAKIRKHTQSDHHIEAHSAFYVLPPKPKDIDELLDIGHATKKPGNWHILLTILQNNRNFMQSLLLRAEDNA